jgi:hypothetical protein
MQTKIVNLFLCATALLISCRKLPTETPILFPRTISEIRTMSIDGSNDHPLTNEQHIIQYANFLPNGEKIVYVDRSISPQVVFSINPDGTGKTLLFAADIFYPISPELFDLEQRILFTKDSKHIIYSTYDENTFAREIYSINVDGTNKFNITNNNGKYIIHGFSMSNDNQRIIYSEFGKDSTNNRICIIRLDGTNKIIAKSFGSTMPMFPQFLPTDNDTIIYLDGDQIHGFLLKRFSLVDTVTVTTIAQIPRVLVYPTITKLNKIFFSNVGSSTGIYSINLLSGEKLVIPTGFLSWISPSPDGLLLIAGNGLSSFTVFQMDGAAMRTINAFPDANDVVPFLSPSNQQILYRSITTIGE